MTATALLWLAATVAWATASPATAQPSAPASGDRDIVQMQGDLYRVRDGRQQTVFLVTADGILVGDPLTRSSAAWLREELAVRFPGRPVRFVVVSHHDYARAEGAGLFTDAQIVGHARFNDELNRARRTFSASLASLDRNNNRRLEAEELTSVPDGTALLERDRDGDGVSAEELYWGVTSVERRYDDRETITLGGQTVEAIHVGYAGAPEMTLLYFPKQRVAFTADVPFTSQPFGFGPFRPRDVVKWARTVGPLAVDELVIGDGRRITPAETSALAEYVVALTNAVAQGYDEGRSVAELQASPLLDSHGNTPYSLGRQAQIPIVYRDVQLLVGEVYGVALFGFLSANDAFCQNYDTCSRDTRVTAGSTGLTVSLRRVGIAVELSLGAQSAGSRTSRFYDDALVSRDSRGSLLARIATAPGKLSIAAVAGPSLTMVDVRGETVVRGALPPVGGRHPVAERHWKYGVTFGFDAVGRVGSAVSVVAPVRVTRTFGLGSTLERPVGTVDIQAGVGLAVRVLRRVRHAR